MADTTTSSRGARRKAARPRSRFPWPLIGGGAALVALIVYFTWQQAAGGLDPAQVPDPALGPADAPVVIAEYADFGCPACRSWHAAGIRDQVLAEFGDQVRFEWKDFPVITPRSPQAAEAGLCAGAQGKFWEFHDAAYDQYAGLEDGALRQYAQAAGVDLDAFDRCLADGQMRRKVQASTQEARQLGLRGTPGFTVNGKPLPAPPSYEQLAASVQAALAAQ